MKECVDCGKKLGIIEGYRHPVKGKDFLLCSKCFDTVSESVEKWSEFISPYIGFFNSAQNQNYNTHFGGIFNNTFFKKDIKNAIKN